MMISPVTLSMDGLWDFFYSPKPFMPGISKLPSHDVFTGKMVTPGYWDDHYDLFAEEDFFGLTARFNPDYRPPHFPMGRSLTPHASSCFMVGTGFYRKRFRISEPFASATLTIGPAMWGCSVFCNGNFAGNVTGYSTESTYVLDDFLFADQDNELIIVVCNVHDDGGAYHRLDETHDGIPFGTRPGQHRGLAAQGYQSERAGINGGVSLKLTPHATLVDYFISFTEGVPFWHVETRNGTAQLAWSMSFNGDVLDSGTVDITDCVEFTSKKPIRLWSDRHPDLYDITLTLKSGNVITDTASFKWGARIVSVNGMSLEINEIPTLFRGVTEHCYFADTTNPHDDKGKYLRELGVIRSAGFNFIRCHTWCPPKSFYEACDELGFLVQTELPSVWNDNEAIAIMKQIRRHPSAVIFCEGNEKIIDEVAILRLERLVDMLHRLAPGMLFNPQEAMRGIEYAFTPGRELIQQPLCHDPARLNRVRRFADCFGTLGGEFSYSHDDFPGREIIEARNAVYQRPCLDHEAGILGGYLDFSLESRYEDTYIGTDMFKAARKNMQKHGVYHKARRYYEKNSKFISSCRKQLFENLRSCRNMAGFDYLGGIDTHWHLVGYPCGIFNEFYEEKFGEAIEDIRRYCDQSVLLCSAGKQRNRVAASRLSEIIEFSCFEEHAVSDSILTWTCETADGQQLAHGQNSCPVFMPGTVSPAGTIEFSLPDYQTGIQVILKVTLSSNEATWCNDWNFWVFPDDSTIPETVKVVSKLDATLIRQLNNGQAILLTDNFPGTMNNENFRSHTSGRSLGHAGVLFNEHPIWSSFPHEDFLDWQFYPLMKQSKSLVYDDAMPTFAPTMELIPSFKLIKHKSLLSEFVVGQGRLIISGLRFDVDDPAATYLKSVICHYLASGNHVPCPEWPADDLLKRITGDTATAASGLRIDAGGRPIL